MRIFHFIVAALLIADGAFLLWWLWMLPRIMYPSVRKNAITGLPQFTSALMLGLILLVFMLNATAAPVYLTRPPVNFRPGVPVLLAPYGLKPAPKPPALAPRAIPMPKPSPRNAQP